MLVELSALDHATLRWLYAGAAPGWLVSAVVVVSFLGSGWMLLVTLPALAIRELRGVLLWMLAALTATSAFVTLFKTLIGRVRPCNALAWAHVVSGAAPTGPSCPSGHAAGSFAFAAFLFAIDRRFGIVAFPFAMAVAASRVALAVHYPSDVLAGAILGSIVGTAFGARIARSRVPGGGRLRAGLRSSSVVHRADADAEP